jgi:hypothetical protein
MDYPCMPKRLLNEETYGRKKPDQPRKRWITDVEEDLRMSIRRLVSEHRKLTGLEKDCAGGQGPYWTVVPD